MKSSEDRGIQDQVLASIGKAVPGLDVASIPLDANLYELGLDSAAAISLLLSIEEGLDVSFPEAMLGEETFRSARALIAAVEFLVG